MIDCVWSEGDQPGISDVYHSLVCNMMNGVACCKVLFEDGKPKDFIFLAANDAFTRQTGLMDVAGKKITVVIPGISQTDPNLFERHAYESLTGKPVRFETYVNSLGEWLGVSIFSPKPEHFIAVFEVITKGKKEEELHRRIQERYERVIEGSDQCFWDWDLNTHEFTASQRFELMLGYDKGELPGHEAREMLIPPEDWLRYVHPDDLAKAWESIERHLKGQSPAHEVEVRCKTKSGDWKWILTRGRIVSRGKDGKPLIMSGTFTDITERKKAEEREHRLKNIYQALSEVNNAIIHQLDETNLFALVCRVAVECGGMIHAWVGIPDSAGRFIPAAQFGRLSHVPKEFEISARPELPEGRGPTGMAFRENRTVIVNDAINDELLAPFQERVRQDGTGSMAVYPIERSGKPYAIVSFVSDQADAFDDEIVSLLDGMARNISFALANLDREAERKRVEDASRESEERFRLAQQATRSGAFDWDIQNNVIESSPEVEALYGLSPGQFDGKYETWLTYVHPDDRAKANQQAQEAIHSGNLDASWRVLWPDGTVHWLASRGRVFKDEVGNPARMVGINMDITEQKLADEEKAQLSKQRQLALDAARLSWWYYDPAARLISCDERHKEVTGVEGTQLTDEEIMSLVHPDDLPGLKAKIAAAMNPNDPQPYETEIRIIPPDGSMRWLEIYGVVFFEGEGQARYATGVAGTIANVTERKRAEEALKLAATVYQDSSEAMMVTDESNNIISVNQAFTEITGYEPTEVIGKRPSILKSGNHDSVFYRDMWDQVRSAGRYRGEIWNRKKDGELFAAQLTINTISQGDGTPQRYVGLLSDITERKKSEEMIWIQANFDVLTGLPNRSHFRDCLQQEIDKAHRGGYQLALIILDLDGFKDVNDTLGHDTGDVLLKKVAGRLRNCIRKTNMVARLGGDEFTAILTDVHEPGNVDVISRHILRDLSRPYKIGEDIAYISASIGITLYPNDGREIEELVRNADQAMYAAKQEGKNRHHYYTPAMQEAVFKRMRMVNDMRSALEGEQFKIFYQPIVELSSGAVHKAEALIRWQHPEKGLISPAEFIPAAEDTGMITSLGNWIFHESAKQAAIWRTRHHPEFQVSVNISPVQFRQEDIDTLVWLNHLKGLDLPGQGIVVEITERLLLDASPKVIEQLLMLRDAGIEVALDDFGTGYSSLAYLKKFDIDYIKIDRTFVSNLSAESDDMALCEAIIVMAHKLGLKVIAEGVETEAQSRLLASAGCDYAQGYLFSRPVPIEELEMLLGLLAAES